eukprot:TRINITY_DN14010_c0_g1_i2.p1 TRINITY_DN14010_c0_g1~~TRINITY_DN14010_c0_g1_i2.p1  ORF type:complete len:682 (-),score=265.15 TRINITY_DN14010_c0_g1_i2:192-2237(-)
MEQYKKIKRLGEGAFGVCFVVQNSAGKRLAMKEVSIESIGAQERDKAFEEARLLKSLCHPNVIAFQEFFVAKGKLFIIMDYASGGDLGGRIAQRKSSRAGPFPEEEVCVWLVQILMGVKYLHDQKILHRDLKPQNIFLTNKGVVKLGDFGIAKVLESTRAYARTQIGTPFYISPEICNNHKYTSATDLWSLGVILHELLALEPPFSGASIQALVMSILNNPPKPLPEGCQVCAELLALRSGMLHKRPSDRPSAGTILRSSWAQRVMGSFLSSRKEPPQQRQHDRAARSAQAAAQRSELATTVVLPEHSTRAQHSPQQYDSPQHRPAAQQYGSPAARNHTAAQEQSPVQREWQRRQQEAQRNRERCVDDPYNRQVAAAVHREGGDQREMVRRQARQNKQQQAEQYEAELAQARKAAFQDRVAMEHRRGTTQSTPEHPRTPSPSARGSKPAAAAVEQEALLRVAREEAFRERKALEAKYRPRSEHQEQQQHEQQQAPAPAPSAAPAPAPRAAASKAAEQETLLREARAEAFRERKALEAKYRARAQEEEEEEEEILEEIVLLESSSEDETGSEYCSMLDTMKGQLFQTAQLCSTEHVIMLGADSVLDANGEGLPGLSVDPTDSLTTKLESLRAHLEEVLGLELFVEAYRAAGEGAQQGAELVLPEEHRALWTVISLVAKHDNL